MRNFILSFLDDHGEALDLEKFGATGSLSALVLTPRFQASRHVVFLIVPAGSSQPVLVAKVPRLPDAGAFLEREVSTLRAIQAARVGGVDSVPAVVAYEPYQDYPILLETAIVGSAMDPARVRQDFRSCCALGVDWLIDIQRLPVGNGDTKLAPETFLAPLERLAQSLPVTDDERFLLAQTRHHASTLEAYTLPAVLEHGDLSHPNLIIRPGDGLGVVDWELARPQGLVAYDLFFFLTYIAFARRRARTLPAYRSAFREAFWEPEAWASPYLRRYAEALALPPEVLRPLFVLCWARYTGQLLERVSEDGQSGDQILSWLRANRYYALWRDAVYHADKLQFS